ncbi:hypothetical protein DFH08DRAFT_801776 [Mycena albidolilacea]|uniref:Uncharacterized protein n=1 Tax=Mycena albidolilacea TaxID=1033008 RepID=A0AAD7EY74_9AGAR|nr:hypothetical protein DFH08DRAFT_801776 [Mycena albidolilacea]
MRTAHRAAHTGPVRLCISTDIPAPRVDAASRHVRSTASWAECCTSAIDIKTKEHLMFRVPGQGTAVLELLASEDQAPLVRGDTLLVMDLSLDIVDGVSQAEPARPRV